MLLLFFFIIILIFILYFSKKENFFTLTDTVTEKAEGVGGWGGQCTCPNGKVYNVGDNGDFCKSLACLGGKPGVCNESDGPWSHRKVECYDNQRQDDNAWLVKSWVKGAKHKYQQGINYKNCSQLYHEIFSKQNKYKSCDEVTLERTYTGPDLRKGAKHDDTREIQDEPRKMTDVCSITCSTNQSKTLLEHTYDGRYAKPLDCPEAYRDQMLSRKDCTEDYLTAGKPLKTFCPESCNEVFKCFDLTTPETAASLIY